MIKENANRMFERGQATQAIQLYNMAIAVHPSSAVLFANRAAAYIKRNWDGDLYAALRDCDESIRLGAYNQPTNRPEVSRTDRCLL